MEPREGQSSTGACLVRSGADRVQHCHTYLQIAMPQLNTRRAYNTNLRRQMHLSGGAINEDQEASCLSLRPLSPARGIFFYVRAERKTEDLLGECSALRQRVMGSEVIVEVKP